MKLNIYTIYDTASGLYSRPYFDNADASAIRAFAKIATGTEHPISDSPKDYSLHRIGIFDDVTAKITREDNDCLTTALQEVSNSRNVNKDAIQSLDDTIVNLSPGGTA